MGNVRSDVFGSILIFFSRISHHLKTYTLILDRQTRPDSPRLAQFPQRIASYSLVFCSYSYNLG